VAAVLGPIESVFHEVISPDVHIDILHVPPNDRQPVHVLVTCGMSVTPMTGVSDGAPDHIELLIVLPPDWPVSSDAFADPRHYWPVRFLKLLARLPHEYGTWLGYGAHRSERRPARPFATDTALSGAMVLPPLMIDGLDLDDIAFLGVYFVHADELELKLEAGTDALLDIWDERHGATELVDKDRPSPITRPAKRGVLRRK
jgi:hypothetical protein